MIFNDRGVIVPDVSFYQDDNLTPQKIDFAKMRGNGAAGVIIRAGQNNWRDEDFVSSWRDAKAAGLPRGSYWFHDSRSEPGTQANLWKSQIGIDRPELGLWIDLEESYNGTWKGERNWKTFIEAVKMLFPGVLVGVYTANWWWEIQSVSDPAYFSEFPLWVAQYVSLPLYVSVPRPWEKKKACFWQYTAKGNGPAYGTESLNIDLNKFNGTREEFQAFFGLDGVPEPPAGGTMSDYKVRSDSYSMTLRPDHNTGELGTESIPAGITMLADEIWTANQNAYKVISGVTKQVNAVGDKWAHIVSVAGQMKNAWVAITHLGKVYCNSVVPVNPPTTLTLTHTIEVYSDGSMKVDGNPYP